jgi:hypothetical protein
VDILLSADDYHHTRYVVEVRYRHGFFGGTQTLFLGRASGEPFETATGAASFIHQLRAQDLRCPDQHHHVVAYVIKPIPWRSTVQ